MTVERTSHTDIDGIRVSCKKAAETLLLVGEMLRPGMTTDDIDRIVYDDTIRRSAVPSPLNYKGFPKSVCTSDRSSRPLSSRCSPPSGSGRMWAACNTGTILSPVTAHFRE